MTQCGEIVQLVNGLGQVPRTAQEGALWAVKDRSDSFLEFGDARLR